MLELGHGSTLWQLQAAEGRIARPAVPLAVVHVLLIHAQNMGCALQFSRQQQHVICVTQQQVLQDERGVSNDIDLDADAFKELVARYKSVYAQHGHVFPDNPCEQLRQAIVAVFRSWQAPRAVAYRELNGIHGLAGTAVNVQARSVAGTSVAT
jgi:Pyruvate phosphate dikinase, AMP/ATP-binding domain